MATRSPAGDIDWTKPSNHRTTNEPQRHRRERYLSPYYNQLAKTKNGNLLEVGCSSGFMMTGIKQRYGIECFGVEPSNVFRDLLLNEGYPVFSSLDEIRSKKRDLQFDLITHFFVLEHIQDPAPFLKNQYEMLKPGGKIVFEIPNAADPLRTLFPTEAFEKFYWSIAHPWYFTEGSINHLLKEMCGFTDFSIDLDQRYDIGNHSRWMLKGTPGGQGKLDSIFKEDFHEAYRRALIDAKLADTLVVTVRKSNI
ncbi:MAG: class I SAM-dependent methyltransferase [Proteobacteria bacterium]|nr:MAG: class I SAM-dependent methyltransferase [Pseudomonadota bacterium]